MTLQQPINYVLRITQYADIDDRQLGITLFYIHGGKPVEWQVTDCGNLVTRIELPGLLIDQRRSLETALEESPAVISYKFSISHTTPVP